MAEDRRPLSTLDVSGPAHVVAIRWQKWKRSFQFYTEGQQITDSARRRALLLHYAGTTVQDIYETLEEDETENDVYQRCVDALNEHFQTEPNIPFERYTFWQMAQKGSETIDQFAARLRQQAKFCSFSDTDDQIRDQIIEKLLNAKLRRKLLEIRNIGLQNLLQTARAWEVAEQQAQGMTSSTVPDSVNTVTRSTKAHKNSSGSQGAKQFPKPKSDLATTECSNCGRKGHSAKSSTCPAKGKTCSKCGKKNHFAAKCRSAAVGRRDEARLVDHEDCMDYYHAFTIAVANSTTTKNDNECTTHINIGGIRTDALIDSGASCNVMGHILREAVEERATSKAKRLHWRTIC